MASSSLRTAIVDAAKGTRWGRRIFMRGPVIVQSALPKSISDQFAARNSPGRTNVRASSCNPLRTSGMPLWLSIARSNPARVTGSTIAARARTVGVSKAPRSAAVGSPDARPVATAKRKTEPMNTRSRCAVSNSRELPRHEALGRLRRRDRADGPCAKGGSGEPHQPFELYDEGAARQR
jgi:hypothetical protein